MTDTPIIETLTPVQATAELGKLTEAFRGAVSPGTAAEAAAQLDALISNTEWSRKYMDGGAVERAKFAELTARIAAGDSIADMVAGKAEPPSIEVTVGDELPSRTMLQAVADLQARGLTDQAITEVLNGQKFSAEQVTAAERWRDRVMSDAVWRSNFLKGNPDCARELLVANAIISAGIAGAA